MYIQENTSKLPMFFRIVLIYVVIAIAIFLGIQLTKIVNYRPVITRVSTQVMSSDRKVDYGTIISKTIIDGQPQIFKVERLGINLAVKAGAYDASNNAWTLSDNAIYYIDTTPIPNNQSGNTVLYGHNNSSSLSPLSELVDGDIAIIETTNGYVFRYTYSGDEFVSPNYTDVLYDTTDTPKLTIITCDGLWSQTRRLMYFNLQDSI